MEAPVQVLCRQQNYLRAITAVRVQSHFALQGEKEPSLEDFDFPLAQFQLDYVGRLAKLTGFEYATSLYAQEQISRLIHTCFHSHQR